MSDELEKAREYEKNFGSRIKGEDRPLFHFSPYTGWMNDPNGFCFYKGKYHLFYQYHPYSTVWGPMHWGHACSANLMHWEYLPAVLAPDSPCDEHGCFSGSALTLSDGRQLLMYTGVFGVKDAEGREKDIQRQCLAVGDGINYEKYSGNPVLGKKDIPENYSIHDFRDPKMFVFPDSKFGAAVVCRSDDGSGAALLFVSEDGFSWKFASVIDRSSGMYGSMWECPDFFELNGVQVLLLSLIGAEPGRDGIPEKNCCAFFTGSFSSKDLTFTRRKIQAVDFGTDFYAPQTLCTDDGRRIMIAWMQSWDNIPAHPEAKWFGQMTLPRELTVRDGQVFQNPVKEFSGLHGSRVSCRGIDVNGEWLTLDGISGNTADIMLSVRPLDAEIYRSFTIRFADGGECCCRLTYEPASSVLTLRRHGYNAGAGRNACFCTVLKNNGVIRLRIVLDRFSAEVFVNDGEQAMSMSLYTPAPGDGISFACDGKAEMDIDKYDIVLP